MYAFPPPRRGCDGETVFVWEHETDSRSATAYGLERYLRGERWHEQGP